MSNSQQLIALTNGRIILPERVVEGHTLLIEGAVIRGVVPEVEVPAGCERVDAGGRYISPGLVDIHIHGALGYTFNDPTEEAFATILNETARRGITSVLATTAGAPISDLVACLA